MLENLWQRSSTALLMQKGIGEHPYRSYRSTGDLLLFGDSKIKSSSSLDFPVELQVTLAQIGDSGQSLRAGSPGTKFTMQNKGTIGLTLPGCVWKSDLPQTGNCIPRILENHGMFQTKPPPFSTCKFHPKSFFASHPSHLSHPTSYPSYQLMDPSSAPYFDSLKNVGAIQNRWFFSHDNG